MGVHPSLSRSNRAILRRAAAVLCALVVGACGEVTDKSHPAIARPLESIRPAKVALVLGSGGPRGFAHIGVLKVLDEAGIHPDLIVGSSVGALVGTLYASGMSARVLEQVAGEMSLIRFYEPRELFGKLGTGRPIEAFVDEELKNRPIESLPLRVAIAATRLRDRSLVLFGQGDAGLAVRASSADPDRYEPVTIEGEAYADGDLVSPVPIRAARENGAQFVIAVDVSAYAITTPPGVPKAWIDKDARRARQIAAEAPQANVLLHPDIGYYAGFSADYRRRAIAAAERYTREKLPEIREAMRAAER